MTIIISKDNKHAMKLKRTVIDKEDFLQQYIHDNPEVIPIYEIEEDNRLLVLSKEFPTNSGPLDALAIDQKGNIYIVETKLYMNPDKIKVVAQVLDYGASLWMHSYSFEEFTDKIDVESKNYNKVSFNDRIKSFFALDDEETDTPSRT